MLTLQEEARVGVSNNDKAKYVVLAFTLVMVSKQFMEIKTKNGNIEANSSLIIENSQFKIYINFYGCSEK